MPERDNPRQPEGQRPLDKNETLQNADTVADYGRSEQGGTANATGQQGQNDQHDQASQTSGTDETLGVP